MLVPLVVALLSFAPLWLGLEADDRAWLRQAALLDARRGVRSRCLIPEFDGAVLSSEWKEALWAKFSMGAPQSLCLG